jgi:hypothetical protein
MNTPHQVALRLTDSSVITPDAAARRRLARAVVAAGERVGLLAFRSFDTHVRLVTLASRADVGRFTGALQRSLVTRLGLAGRFEPARIRPVPWERLDDVVADLIDCDDHHGLAGDLFHDGGALPDLVGARAIGGKYLQRNLHLWTRCVASLPAISHPAAVDLPWPIAMLRDATLAAAGLHEFERSAAARAARRAMLHHAGPELGCVALARALRCSPRAIRNLERHTPVDSKLTQAVARQLTWRLIRLPTTQPLVWPRPASPRSCTRVVDGPVTLKSPGAERAA